MFMGVQICQLYANYRKSKPRQNQTTPWGFVLKGNDEN